MKGRGTTSDMMSTLRDDCLGPVLLLLSLFLPVIIAIAIIPLALVNLPFGWVLIALIVVDYIVPLQQRPWTSYHDRWVKAIALSFRCYFPAVVLHVDPAFKMVQDRRYLFCAHPHGIFGFYIVPVMDYLLNLGSQMTSFAAPILVQLPLARRHFSWMGITSADAKNMRRCLQSKYPHNVFWSTPGGIEEAFCVPDPDEQIVVSKRKGFCKIALQCGTDLVPVYGFGNNQMFPVQGGRDSMLAKMSHKLNVTLMVWLGRFGIPFSCMPVKHPQLVAIGAPIPVEQCASPSQEQIDDLHNKYCGAIRQLFDQHKTDPILETTGFANRKLYFEDEKKSK